MVRLNLTQAAKTAGISRSTLYRHIREGRVSRTLDKNDEPAIDTAELLRAYGALTQSDSATEHSIVQVDTDVIRQNLDHETALLKLKLEHSEELRRKAEEEKEKWQEQSERLSLLITDNREKSCDNKKFHKFMEKIRRKENYEP